jgi:hypothetical protein
MGSDPPLDNARWGLQLPGHSGVVGFPYGLDMGRQLGGGTPVQTSTRPATAYWGSALAPWTGRYVLAVSDTYTFVYVAYQLAACYRN